MASSALKTALLEIIKPYIGLVLIALTVFSCKAKKDKLPFYNTADFTAEWIDEKDSNYATIHTIDTFSFYSQQRHLITKDSLNGYVYVANFFFTICPSICPKMTNHLKIVQDTFANNNKVKLVSFSVMPWVDSVPRLKEYGDNHHINPNKWYLLTGNKERIYQLGRQSYFSEKRLGLQKDSTEFLHTESMLLIDTKGRIRGIYNGTDKGDVRRLIENMERLLEE